MAPRQTPAPPRNPQAARALARAHAYRDVADANATRRAYASDVKIYEDWCRKAGWSAFPATPEVVGAFLAHFAGAYAQATLRRRVAAIARETRLRGAPLDTKDPKIRETLRGVARTHGARGRRAAAITIEDVRKLAAVCEDGLAGRRDRALILLGFAGAFRRSELAALDLAHIRWTRRGIVVLVERSKTDGEGAGAEIAIERGVNAETCPVRALKQWCDLAGLGSGPIFRKVAKGGRVQERRLSGDGVRQIVKRRGAQAGLKGSASEFLSPHGLRAGFVTTAYANGVSDEEIMGQTRHRSLETMRSYVRRAKLGKGSPSGKLGL